MPARLMPLVIFLALGMLLTPMAAALAEPPADMGGWEIDGAYNRLYDPREMDEFKGTVEKIFTLTPMAGMAPATVMLVAESPDAVNLVHVCPEWFAGPNEIGLRRGDRVKVKGVWAEINGEFVFMASKIKKGDHFEFKVRVTSDGRPFWTMTPEEQTMNSNN